MLTSLMPVWEAQEIERAVQHPESPLWGILSDAEAAHVISSDGLNGHRVADFPPPFPLLIPLKDLGPRKPMSGKTVGVLHSVPLTCSVATGQVLFLLWDAVPYMWNRDLDKTRDKRCVCLCFFAWEPTEEKQNDDKVWKMFLLSLIQNENDTQRTKSCTEVA